MDEAQGSAVVHGGRHITARTLDGNEEKVLVRLVPVDELGEVFSLAQDTKALVAFFTGKDTAWAGSLDPQSFMDVYEGGMDLNFSNAVRWGKLQMRLGEAAAPLTEKAKHLSPAVPSQASAPKSA